MKTHPVGRIETCFLPSDSANVCLSSALFTDLQSKKLLAANCIVTMLFLKPGVFYLQKCGGFCCFVCCWIFGGFFPSCFSWSQSLVELK